MLNKIFISKLQTQKKRKKRNQINISFIMLNILKKIYFIVLCVSNLYNYLKLYFYFSPILDI